MMFGQDVHMTESEVIGDEKDQQLNRHFKHLRVVKGRVWARWRNEYLNHLRERHDLRNQSKELKLNEVM